MKKGVTLISNYLNNISARFKTGIATEHTYRGDLQTLLEGLAPGIMATNEPARIKCGAPDYIITKKNIPIGYIEAKDIGKSLDDKAYKEQFDRYRKSLGNLIITDYLDFRLYRDGEFVTSVKIADAIEGKIIPRPETFDQFSDLMGEFSTHVGQTIRSAPKLAKMMAGKARLLANVIEKALTSDEEGHADSTLHDQMAAFKKILIHDIEPKGFADIYSQTIAYGMFAARLHDPTLEDFSRQEAAELIPKSNPFLRKLFQYIAGYDLDDRIKWIVDALADIFRATDVAALLNNFGKSTQQNDPMIHFYETFLAEYDPKLRKSRGVWYTPEPVVNFIVRAVDDILKTEFNLPQGLADTSKTKVEVKTQSTDARYKEGVKTTEQEVHKVQILDPATGTGTFLAEVVKQIYKKFEGQQGIWPGYVEEHLIPRLNGFELLMASYAMAHLKLDLLLTETGYTKKRDQRLKVYLTNSLEEHHPDTGTLFASWLSNEASEANYIKRDTPVMVVLGNPPYSVSSSNKGPWIQNLIADYKKDLKERTINSLSDDYVKFLRYSEYFIEKNGQGVVAMITNNSFIDGITFRQMRRCLLETFNKIYILDLHGNSLKQEVSPDGSKDENVFDIQQGVSINIFIRTEQKKKTLGEVYHFDSYGKRQFKYDHLWGNTLTTINWTKLPLEGPQWSFVPKDYALEKLYNNGFGIDKLSTLNSTGIQTKRDNLFIDFEASELLDRVKTLLSQEYDHTFEESYSIKDSSSYFLMKKIKECSFNNEKLSKVQYRPFDKRNIYYDTNLLGRPFVKVMQHLLCKNNMAIIATRKNRGLSAGYVFVANEITDLHLLDSAADSMQVFPLYLYPETSAQQTLDGRQERTPNLNMEIVGDIAKKTGLAFTPEKEEREGTFAPIDILDYIYAVLHSPAYRKKYKEFLKIDFPRVPYPTNAEDFWWLVKLGGELRQIHLLESPVVEKFITTYPIGGDNSVTRSIGKKDFEIINKDKSLGRVWINDTQYFDNIPTTAWEFYIGGYQPAQKWLKDRKGRVLSYEDIIHYQKIIVALTETDRIMGEIDKVEAF